MALTLHKSAAHARGATTRPSLRRGRVVVKAADNAAEAKQWIQNWKDKKAASANRTSWFPGNDLPPYLDGTLAGDFGFDPLKLGEEPSKLAWYVQAELVHARFAMLGVAGVLLPDLLKSLGQGGPAAQVAWYDAGKFEYFAPASALFGVQILLFAFVEARRYQDILKPGSANQDPFFSNNKLPDGNTPGYPGGIFDPLGYSKGNLEELKLKEIKNGRLAMLAFAGFAVQAYTVGKSPLECLSLHLADPWNNLVWTNSAHLANWRIQ